MVEVANGLDPTKWHRFELEMLQRSGPPTARFGIYRGYHEALKDSAKRFMMLGYNEQTGMSNGRGIGTIERSIQNIVTLGGKKQVSQAYLDHTGTFQSEIEGDRYRWRRISVTFGPTRDSWEFDGTYRGGFPRALQGGVDSIIRKTLGLLSNETLDFAPAHGVGILIASGTASFRKARVLTLEAPLSNP